MYEALIFDLRGREKSWPQESFSLDYARIKAAADALEEMNRINEILKAEILDLEERLEATQEAHP